MRFDVYMLNFVVYVYSLIILSVTERHNFPTCGNEPMTYVISGRKNRDKSREKSRGKNLNARKKSGKKL